MRNLNILFLGDIVGPDAVEAIRKNLYRIKKEHSVDMVIANGENANFGNGITPDDAETLFTSGVDVITGGNHSFRQRSIYNYLDDTYEILRPANYSGACPGHGYAIVNAGVCNVLVMNVQGVVYMDPIYDPFDTVEDILEREEGNFDIAVLDFHAEATGEKKTLANAFKERINVFVGTHTHVRTADLQILDSGCGYITDLGMCGVHDSSLGVNYEDTEAMMRLHMPRRFTLAKGKIVIEGALFEIDTQKRKTVDVKPISVSV